MQGNYVLATIYVGLVCLGLLIESGLAARWAGGVPLLGTRSRDQVLGRGVMLLPLVLATIRFWSTSLGDDLDTWSLYLSYALTGLPVLGLVSLSVAEFRRGSARRWQRDK